MKRGFPSESRFSIKNINNNVRTQRLNTNMTPDSLCLRFGCKYMLINAFSFGIVLTYSYLCNHKLCNAVKELAIEKLNDEC
jgi:hypothetical protein